MNTFIYEHIYLNICVYIYTLKCKLNKQTLYGISHVLNTHFLLLNIDSPFAGKTYITLACNKINIKSTIINDVLYELK